MIDTGYSLFVSTDHVQSLNQKAILTYLTLSIINSTFANVPTTPGVSGCSLKATDCFSDDIFPSVQSNHAQLSVLNGTFSSANSEVDKSKVIEMDEIAVKGC